MEGRGCGVRPRSFMLRRRGRTEISGDTTAPTRRKVWNDRDFRGRRQD